MTAIFSNFALLVAFLWVVVDFYEQTTRRQIGRFREEMGRWQR